MKNRIKLAVLSLCLISLISGMITLGAEQGNTKMKLIEVKKIWDQAPHNAFTDLIRFKDRWFCTFREAGGHSVDTSGKIRILSSKDGVKWESAALLSLANHDLRDPHFSITPKGELMINGAGVTNTRSETQHQSMAWFSRDGRTWSKGHEIGDKNFWLWRVTWHRGTAYTIGYGCKEKLLRLYTSKDGKKYDTLVERLYDLGYPNEATIVFKGDTLYCLMRRNGKGKYDYTALTGISKAPYTKWEWKRLGKRCGGPHMILLPDKRFLASGRFGAAYNNTTRTALRWIDPRAGKFKELLELPSAGDNSYTGMVLVGNILWVSYYSSHEGKTSIYLAKVKISK